MEVYNSGGTTLTSAESSPIFVLGLKSCRVASGNLLQLAMEHTMLNS
jgi:hypothetical protein